MIFRSLLMLAALALSACGSTSVTEPSADAADVIGDAETESTDAESAAVQNYEQQGLADDTLSDEELAAEELPDEELPTESDGQSMEEEAVDGIETDAKQVTDSTAAPSADCVTITDFTDATSNDGWLVVNDNVMGGQSIGDREFVDETMVFSGSINLDGGGFSSLRLPLGEGVLVGADRIVFRALGDERDYVVTFDDSLEGRNRRISFRAPVDFATPGEWETVSVALSDLAPAAFGQPVEAEPFRLDLATRMGIMLSDGVDGEFRLEIDWIQLCGAN